MRPNSSCPECGKALPARAERCRCGWKLPVTNSNEPLADGRCEYFVAGRRCPLPGTCCQYPYSKGPWYCAGHLRCLDDQRLGEAVLRHAEENYEAIIAERRDWRDVELDKRLSLWKKKVTVKQASDTQANNSHFLYPGEEASENANNKTNKTKTKN